MKSAKITPKGTNSHTLSSEIISAGLSSDGLIGASCSYTFRHGFTEKYEAGFGVDLVIPQFSIGCKYGFTKMIALDMNIKVYYNLLYEEGGSMFYPNMDLAIIFGAEKWYGGIKYTAVTSVNNSGELNPFLGIRLHIKNNFYIIPEIGTGLVEINYLSKRNRISFIYTNIGPFIGFGIAF